MKNLFLSLFLFCLVMFNASCKQYDVILGAWTVRSTSYDWEVKPNFPCGPNTWGTAPMWGQANAQAGQLVVGFIHDLNSCATGDGVGGGFARGAVKLDLSSVADKITYGDQIFRGTWELTFEQVGGDGVINNINASCEVAMLVAASDWVALPDTAAPSDFSGTPLQNAYWGNAQPTGQRVTYGFDATKGRYVFHVDVRDAVAAWLFGTTKPGGGLGPKLPNNGFIFLGSDERDKVHANETCYQVLGNFSLHAVFTD
jgi:hypothetical protein